MSSVAFASKSFPCTAIYRVMAEEGLHIDVAGGGELVTALKAGVAPEHIVLHGNAKTDEELALAISSGVGTIVIDGWDDITRLESIAGPRQSVLLRVIPGVDAPTMAAIATGHHGSKFGLPFDASPPCTRPHAGEPPIPCARNSPAHRITDSDPPRLR